MYYMEIHTIYVYALISISIYSLILFHFLSFFYFCSFPLSHFQIRLDSASILMPNLKIVPSTVPSASSSSSAMPFASTHDHHHQPAQHHHKIYQLCACSNGKLFLAMSHSICAGDESTVCR